MKARRRPAQANGNPDAQCDPQLLAFVNARMWMSGGMVATTRILAAKTLSRRARGVASSLHSSVSPPSPVHTPATLCRPACTTAADRRKGGAIDPPSALLLPPLPPLLHTTSLASHVDDRDSHCPITEGCVILKRLLLCTIICSCLDGLILRTVRQ